MQSSDCLIVAFQAKYYPAYSVSVYLKTIITIHVKIILLYFIVLHPKSYRFTLI